MSVFTTLGCEHSLHLKGVCVCHYLLCLSSGAVVLKMVCLGLFFGPLFETVLLRLILVWTDSSGKKEKKKKKKKETG